MEADGGDKKHGHFVLIVDSKKQEWILNPAAVKYGHANAGTESETTVYVTAVK